MKLTILGGGGFRVPLVYRALASPPPPDSVTSAHRFSQSSTSVTEVVLHDVDEARLAAIRAVLERLPGPAVRTTTDLDDALSDARFVFAAIRVDGLAGRTLDERVALAHGVLGQETTGAGGIAYGLRTVPVAVRIAERIAAVAPHAWTINFTNPAGMITEAMRRVLGDRVVGICDSPVGLIRRACAALGIPEGAGQADYVGLNHLGWLRGLRVDGTDRLPGLLADDYALAGIEEARLIGPDWVRDLGALPNEYLYYFYRNREAVRAIRGAASTRGEYLAEQQERFYASVTRDPAGALARWEATRAERDASYMAEGRAESEQRAEEDIAIGGYQEVALHLMAALLGEGPDRVMILNVRNGGAVPGLPPEAVVEIPCTVGRPGITPLATGPLPGGMLGLLQQVKAVERDTIEAALTGSAALARRAFAQHPLVDSSAVARDLVDAYRKAHPALCNLLR